MMRNTKVLDRKFVPAGTVVIEQGMPGSRAYMVETGKVEVFVTDAKGSQTVLAELGPNSMFGEMAVVSEGLRSASVRTTADSVLIIVSAHELRQSMRKSEGIYKRLMRMVSERVSDTHSQLQKKEQELAEIGKTAQITLKDVALHISAARQNEFRKEILPLLGQMRSALEKFRPANPKKD